MYEKEVCSFYANLLTVEGDTICLKINGKDFVIDAALHWEILGVPNERLSIVEVAYSAELMNLIIKP